MSLLSRKLTILAPLPDSTLSWSVFSVGRLTVDGAELLVVVGVELLVVVGAELLGFRKLMCFVFFVWCGFFERLVVVSLSLFRVTDFF